MKFRYIKSLLPAASLCLSLGLTSCIGDLDVKPIDPSITQEFYQDEVFYKIYATMSLTGQEGPAGNGDVDGIDEGTSGFYRLIWNLNELPTDEAACSWGDPGIPEMNFIRWSSSHDQLKGLYGRLYFDVTLCNHFLEQTEGKSDDKSIKQRAEARFMRAMNYYYLLDFFGNVPFTTVISEELPKQIARAELYAFIEQELSECEADMYAAGQAPYGRADVVANWLLRSRLYLNAEIYTGTAQWAQAANYAKKVMDEGAYKLTDNYKHLFMADNDGSSVNKAKEEIILPIAADGKRTQCYASAQFIVASTHTEGMNSWGTSEGWGGNRARAALVKKFFTDGVIPADADKTDLSTLGDERAMFFAADRTVEINKMATFKEGLSVAKFSNLRADGGVTSDPKFVDMDIPFLRKAEAYLTFAEATLRMGGSAAEALAAVNELRSRAGATPFGNIDLDRILDEKAREFYFEGHRRTDLIRYGYFAGSTDYKWDWKGGAANGTQVDKIYNLMPLPASDLNANTNLAQNPGY